MNKQASIEMNGFTMSAKFHEIYTGMNKFALSSVEMADVMPEGLRRTMFVALCEKAGLVQNHDMTFDPA